MHMHSEWSDEPLCDMKIPEILERTQKLAEKGGRDCVIAITDHNSILGVKLARDILKKEGKTKYKNVKLINGIEFTTDLTELSSFYNGEQIFTRCHTLAYGFNENDPELTAYSRITHKTFSNRDNIGMQICAARRAVCEALNIYIPFQKFESMVNLPKSANFKEEFISIIRQFANERKLKFSYNRINSLISDYILPTLDTVRKATAFGRLKVSEVSKLVHDAGGELVIAHPALITATIEGMKKLALSDHKNFSDVYVSTDGKNHANSNISHIKDQEYILNKFLDAYETAAKCKVSGLEQYYSSNFSTELYKVLGQVAKKRSMYVTCGSDYHGEHLNVHRKIGLIFSTEMMNEYMQQNQNNLQDIVPVRISELSSLDHLIENKPKSLENNVVFRTDKGLVVEACEIDKLAILVRNKPKTQQLDNFNNVIKGIDLGARLEELSQIADKLDEIIDKANDPKEQAKLMLRLNLFVENIYGGMCILKTKAVQNKSLRTMELYGKITEKFNDIKTKYNALLRHNNLIIKDLKSDMQYYYKKRDVYIGKLVNLDFMKREENLGTDVLSE